MPEISILVVDDDEDDRKLLGDVLRSSEQPLSLRFARSCAEARRAFEGERFDVALVDYQLGDGTAIELLNEQPPVPMIVLTGAGSEEIAAAALRAGAYDYLRKDASALAEQSLRRAIARVLERVEAQRLRELREQELEQFAYVISHDLGSAIRRISINGSELARAVGEVDLPAELKLVGARLSASVDFLRGLLDGLTRFTDASRGVRFAPVDCGEVAKSVLQDLESLPDDAEVSITTLPCVLGDRARIWQLFRNVLTNAIKFRSDRPLRISIEARAGDGMSRLAVSDNGRGIPDRFRKEVFLAFRRGYGPDSPPGVGIGMAISKRIVELHGGDIWFESRPGEGTTFYFTLPTATSDAATP